jgi:hypothetical protein
MLETILDNLPTYSDKKDKRDKHREGREGRERSRVVR